MKIFKLLVAACALTALGANEVEKEPRGEPHLTPEKLVGGRFAKDTFGTIKVAVVGYCPPPASLDKYETRDTEEQYFIHMSPSSVKICKFGDTEFLSIFHVYGGPVGAALIEELSYYGIETVLAYGLGGGFGTKGLKIGDAFVIESAFALDGVTKSYSNEEIIYSDKSINNAIVEAAKENPEILQVTGVRSAAVDAIYREYPDVVENMIAHECDVVNCEASHIFAACEAVGIKATQCGVVSDVMKGSDQAWDSELSKMLSTEEDAPGPLDVVGSIVELFVEKVIPKLRTLEK